MNKDEALHKALKVLNCLNNNRVYETAWVKGAINACEEALEQPSKLTRLEVIDNNGRAYVNMAIDKLQFSYQDEGRTLKIFTNGAGELKTAWRGLTDDEIARLVLINEVDKSGDTGFARLIEQALKEKNHGI
jgi:hypothetical protein